MKHFSVVVALGALMLCGSVQGADAYQQRLQHMDDVARDFSQTNGYQNIDPSGLSNDNYYAGFTDSGGVFAPDADLDALTRAILLVEASEPTLPHVRYLIQLSINSDPQVPELQHSYIEINRYNLGPRLHADLAESIPAEHLAPLSEFGVGPHSSWRFSMSPVMGLQADVLYASRKEITDAAAQQMACLSEPCLSLENSRLPSQYSQEAQPAEFPKANYQNKNAQGTTVAARVAQELWTLLNAEGMDPLTYNKAAPHFIFVISTDIEGQESNSTGVGVQMLVFDDEIKQVGVQRQEIAGSEPFFEQAFIPR